MEQTSGTQIIEIIIIGVGAIGTVLVAVLAIWGEWVRAKLAGPKLEVSLHNTEGEFIKVGDGTDSRFYHLKVRNKRHWAPAKNVRVLLTQVNKPNAAGTFPIRPLSGPLQLTWQHPQFHPTFPTIGPDDVCDLGNLQKGRAFILSPYVMPNNFQGRLSEPGKMRVEIIVAADNAESPPLLVEIAWDGKWSDDTKEMREHLVIKSVPTIDV